VKTASQPKNQQRTAIVYFTSKRENYLELAEAEDSSELLRVNTTVNAWAIINNLCTFLPDVKNAAPTGSTSQLQLTQYTVSRKG
jgi:hypothetical protein